MKSKKFGKDFCRNFNSQKIGGRLAKESLVATSSRTLVDKRYKDQP